MANWRTLNQFQSIELCTTDASMTKLNEQCHVMTIHNTFKFHKIPFIGLKLVMAKFFDFIRIQGHLFIVY